MRKIIFLSEASVKDRISEIKSDYKDSKKRAAELETEYKRTGSDAAHDALAEEEIRGSTILSHLPQAAPNKKGKSYRSDKPIKK